jgi:tRNA pseudouridine13 synthase
VSGALPGAHGAPVLSAQLRHCPEDFVVEEIDAFPASGSGEHLLLTVEKRGLNTTHVARRIADWAGIPEAAVGYAGLKDRHALARQRFSVHLAGRESPSLDLLASEDRVRGESLRVLHAERHARKLPRGALAGNRFRLTLREVVGERGAIEVRLDTIASRGVPNWFGEQRFGRAGDNVARALEMFAGRRVGRAERSILLSAARSELFNRVLARRVMENSWDSALDGEVWALDGSRSVFGPVPWSAELAVRLDSFDIHPSAPLWGRGELRPTGRCRALEQEVLSESDGPLLCRGLEAAGLEQERRPTRLRPSGLEYHWADDGALVLLFALPPGAYATTVLAELGEAKDIHRHG